MKPILIITFFITIGLVSNAQPVKIHGQLHVDKTQLKDATGNDVVLRGMSFGWHNFWPRFYNADAVKWLDKDSRCNGCRA